MGPARCWMCGCQTTPNNNLLQFKKVSHLVRINVYLIWRVVSSQIMTFLSEPIWHEQRHSTCQQVIVDYPHCLTFHWIANVSLVTFSSVFPPLTFSFCLCRPMSVLHKKQPKGQSSSQHHGWHVKNKIVCFQTFSMAICLYGVGVVSLSC